MNYVFQPAAAGAYTPLHFELGLTTVADYFRARFLVLRRGVRDPRELVRLLRPRWRQFRPWAEVGFVPNEGETLWGEMVLKNVTTDRGTNLALNLFTNVSPGETITEATLTRPTGGSYAEITLTDATWSEGAAGVYSYTAQTFTATGSAYTGSIQGYDITSQGTTARIVAIEVDPNGPYTINQNDTYQITPQITVKDSGD